MLVWSHNKEWGGGRDTGKMAPWRRMYTAIPEDPSSIPRTRIRQLTRDCNPSARGSDPMSTCTHMHIAHDKNKSKEKNEVGLRNTVRYLTLARPTSVMSKNSYRENSWSSSCFNSCLALCWHVFIMPKFRRLKRRIMG